MYVCLLACERAWSALISLARTPSLASRFSSLFINDCARYSTPVCKYVLKRTYILLCISL